MARKRHLIDILIIVFVFATFSDRCSGQTASEPWSLERCLEFGLSHHPAIRQTEGALVSAKGKLTTTRAARAVTVGVQNSFSRQKQEFRRATAGSFGGKSDDLVDSNSDSISARKLITDFGQTRIKERMSRTSLRIARENLDSQAISTAADIKSAFFRALQARALLRVQEETVARYQAYLEQVQGLVEVGSRPPFDITKAQANLADARVSLIRAQSNVQNTLALLAKSIGFEDELEIPPPREEDLLGLTSAMIFPPIKNPGRELSFENLLKEALSRPEVKAVGLQVETSKSSLALARKGKNPSLSGSAAYSWSGSVSPLDRSYSVGLSLSTPLIDGGSAKGQVKDAQGGLMTSLARYDQVRQSVRTEVKTSLTNVLDALNRFDATQILVRQASEALTLAESRFSEGVGSSLEVTDARASYVSARGSNVTAYYDSLIALASLDQTLGRLPVECGGGAGAGTAPDETETKQEGNGK